MRAIIVDDERKSREVLKSLLSMFCEDVEVVADTEGIADSLEAIDRHKPDLVFLDIHLKEGDSFQILEALGEFEFSLIFVTAYDEDSVKALQYSGISCLLKPIDVLALQDAVEEVGQHKTNTQMAYQMADGILKNKFRKLPVVTSAGLHYADVDHINYIFAQSSGVSLHFQDGTTMDSSRNLDQFLQVIDRGIFKKLGEHYLINVQRIDSSRSGSGRLIFLNDDLLHFDKSKLYSFLKLVV